MTVTGIDVLSVDKAVNAVVPHARAKVSLRVHPEQDPVEAQASLIRHLEELKPFGVSLTVHALETGTGFAAKTDGPAYDAAREALAHAWGGDTVSIATGGSIPLVNAMQQAAPDAEMLLFGTTDGFANIHAPNERVVVDEFEKATLAEAEFFGLYAERVAGPDERVGGRPSDRGARAQLPRARARQDRAHRQQDARTRRSSSSSSAAV